MQNLSHIIDKGTSTTFLWLFDKYTLFIIYSIAIEKLYLIIYLKPQEASLKIPPVKYLKEPVLNLLH